MIITEEIAQKVLSTVDQGLCRGKGVQIPGKMCVEAAVCFALGLPHSDEPPCVHPTVRSFKIALNDHHWSSDIVRAKGMRRIAVAQLGSVESGFNVEVFVKELALATIRKMVPIALRAAAQVCPYHADKLRLEAGLCEKVIDLKDGKVAAVAAYDAAYDAANDAAKVAAYAAANAAANAAYAAANAAKAAAKDEIYSIMAEAGIEALKLAGSPGCKFLYLCD